MKKVSKVRMWLSRKVYELLRPALYAHVEGMVECALAERRSLSSDIRAFILDDLNQRIPVESTTHSLAVHVRDHAKQLERRLDWLDGHLVVDSHHGNG